MILVLFNINKQ